MCEAEDDQFFKGQPELSVSALGNWAMSNSQWREVQGNIAMWVRV